MVVKKRAGLLLSGTVLASIFVAAPAFAEDAQTDRMQRQINALQKQFPTLQNQITKPTARQRPRSKHPDRAADGPEHPARPLQRGCSRCHQSRSSILVRRNPRFPGRRLHRDGKRSPARRTSSGATILPFSTLPFHNSPLYFEDETQV